MVYYNEIDPFAVAWLNELIKAGLIADGVVDARPIEDVDIDDLRGFDQCHFFAGVGGWSYALRLAGWPDDRQVWTGSCPCQPFSSAGKQKGFDDARHLWPVWADLIALGRPATLFGEQVASPAGLNWFDLVSADLEDQDYAVAAADLCAASVGSPHIRQRLYWVADSDHARSQGRIGTELSERAGECVVGPSGASGELADTEDQRLKRFWDTWNGRVGSPNDSESCGLGDSDAVRRGERPQQHGNAIQDPANRDSRRQYAGRPGGYDRFWSAADWLYCQDDKYRPVEPGTFPLAHGAPARVGRLRGYGNAIVPQVAQAFIESFLAIG